MTLAVGIVAFAGGLVLLVAAVERLVATMQAWAVAAGMSGVVLSALVLGVDLESTATGVAATLDDLPGTALGSSIGAAIFLLSAGLGLAGVFVPFEVRAPRPLLVASGAAPLVAVVLMLDGRLTRLDGAVLVASGAALFWLIARARHATAPTPTPTPTPDPPTRLPLRLAAALAGLVLGAELLVAGTERIVDRLDLSETAFGLLVVGAAVSFEEVVLELLPAYRGFPELTVGNALGTLVFLVAPSLGVIALVRPLDVAHDVRVLHAPVLLGATALAIALLARGRIGRPGGALLLAAYVAYALSAVAVA